MLESLTLETFASRIGERFRLSANAEHSLDVTLVEATAPPEVRFAGTRSE
jgi:hypothetical protein